MRFACGLPIAVLLLTGWTLQAPSPLEDYRKLKFPKESDKIYEGGLRFVDREVGLVGWKDRVAMEYEVVRAAEREALRAALRDSNRFVRSLAAHTLGILGDKASAEAIAGLAKADPEYSVRERAFEALGWLKTGSEAIDAGLKDPVPWVRHQAEFAADRLRSDVDFAAKVREAYAIGIRREAIDSAKVGGTAPVFSVLESGGEAFRLSDVLGKKVILLHFLAADF